jgi:hypothetical protein
MRLGPKPWADLEIFAFSAAKDAPLSPSQKAFIKTTCESNESKIYKKHI